MAEHRTARLAVLAVLLALVLLATVAHAEPEDDGWTTSEIIEDRAIAHGVSPQLMVCLARLESGLNPAAVGDAGLSIGLFQLYRYGLMPRFWSQGYTNLLDPWDQADFAARAVAAGSGPAWTVWWRCA